MSKTPFSIIDDFIYELNVDHTKCSTVTSSLLSALWDNGFTIVPREPTRDSKDE